MAEDDLVAEAEDRASSAGVSNDILPTHQTTKVFVLQSFTTVFTFLSFTCVSFLKVL